MKLYLGIDIGTSGVRCAIIDAEGNPITSSSIQMEPPEYIDDRPCQDATIWWKATCDCLNRITADIEQAGHRMSDVAGLSVDGTSGTLLLTDANLEPLTRGYLYNSANFDEQAAEIDKHAPKESLARGSGSALARLLFLQSRDSGKARHVLHQADWIAAKLMNRGGISDETNVLKMGYDVVNREWPSWLSDCGVDTDLIPEVVPVGDEIGVVSLKQPMTLASRKTQRLSPEPLIVTQHFWHRELRRLVTE